MTISEQLNPADVQKIIQALNIKTNGADSAGWTSIKSPLRDDDKNPSFGLNLNNGSFKDHGTGEAGDIVDLVKTLHNVDFKGAKDFIISVTSNKLDQNGRPTKKIVATYDYTDQNGKLSYQVVRYEPKGFAQRMPDGKGGWVYNTRGVRRELYRLPNVIEAVKNNKTVFVVEGEKDVHTLEKLGLAATTNAGGQGKWKPFEYNRRLEGGNIILIPDNDEVGVSHMEDIALNLHRVANIKLVQLPGLDKKGDVTDWINKGNTLADLNRIIEDTPAWSHGSTAKSPEKVSATNATNATRAIVPFVPIEEHLDISTAPAIPQQVYNALPEMLKTRCNLIAESHQRDVFLVATLPVVAAHMGNVLAAHRDCYYTPDLYTQIIADPGQGKGIAGKALKLGAELNRSLIEKSKEAKIQYLAKTDEEKARTGEPQDQCLYIPANSSSRAMYDTLQANDGCGLLFETEIDTLLNATGQEWGNFSDITRKAFHHEPISINRKGERYFLEDPRLSICITGTFDQFKKMFENAENGHFSRYALYTFNAPMEWQSHRPTQNSISLNESIQTASLALHQMYERLKGRSKPLYIDLTPEQWDMIDNTFAEKMQIIDDIGLSKYLHASNNRTAVLALRMASIFTVLRTYEVDPNMISLSDKLTPTYEDMEAALWLADTFIQHAIRLYHILPTATDTNIKGERFNDFYQALPGEFETADAVNIAKGLDIPERTTKRWLTALTGKNLTRTQRGQYEKVPQL